jgi:pseudaminic acid synthase
MTPFIIAEMSCNHLGSLDRAIKIVQAAAWAGADAIKLQTWSPGTMCVDKSYALPKGPWAGRNLSELYEEAWTPWEWHPIIFEWARKLGMVPFSAAFDRESVDFLEGLGVDRHKVASFELTDLPLIRYMASKGKPMILSTGMATKEEIDSACDAVWDGLTPATITILKCTSAYPADVSDANLKTMGGFFRWGLSDHTPGIGVAVAATALGATMIEKHLTLSRADGGPDAGFSMEPHEFKQMVTECRRAAAAIGTVKYGPGPNEDTSLRRSLWITQPTKKGDRLVLGVNVATARPALGLPPSTDLTYALAARDMEPGTALTQEMLG